jgi:tetratricopeptide (TPR) repeat protein
MRLPGGRRAVGTVRAASTGPPPPAATARRPPGAAKGVVLIALVLAACQPQSAQEAAPPLPSASSPVDRAVARWARRAEHRPGDGAAWTQLGNALMQKARETMDGSYYGRAERAFARAWEVDRTNAEAALGLAWVHGGRHEFPASIAWARTVLALDPANAAAHGLLGDAAVETGDYAAARTHYRTMVDLRPDLSSYSRAAHLLHLTGDSRAAILVMQQAIASGGPYAENTAWCRAQLALMHLDVGNPLAADHVVQDALARTPHSAAVLVAAGRVRSARGDYDGAIAAYQRAAAVAPQHDIVVALGDLYRLQGRDPEAERQYALAEAIHALNRENGIRGDVQIAQFRCEHDRQLGDALRIAEAAFAETPNVAVADTLAWCYHKNGRPQEAKRLIAHALGQHTPNAAFLFHAGAIHAAAGERALAQRYLSQALSLNPSFHPVAAAQAVQLLAQLGSRAPS